jgi:outer membrane protein OmpA-like peptidoglycan-associated protein
MATKRYMGGVRAFSAGRASTVVAAALVGCSGATALPAQTLPPERASGIHLLVGGFAGRFDLDGAGRTDLFGGQAGVGYRELLQLTGFYWRGFDRSEDAVTADHAWGGELQFNLNTGFGLTPFVTGGIARVHAGETADQTAALAGAGLTFPLGPVLLNVAARDYMFGVTGLENDDSPEDVTHNWLYSAGVKFALGTRRRGSVATPVPPRDERALRAARAELDALRDSIRLAGGDPAAAPRAAWVDSIGAPRNYQSGDRIEIPLPTEGSITLRYGPERAAAVTPVVVTVPGSPPPLAGAASEVAAVPPPPPGATLADPATQAWLQQQVAAQVAQQLAQRPTEAPAMTQAQLDALAQRVLDGVLTSAVPRLEAAQARRIDGLREDLRLALQQQQAGARTAAGAVAPAPVAVAPAPVAPAVPSPAPSAVAEAVEPAATPETRGDEAALAADRAEAAQRMSLGAVVAAHPAYLTSRETERGPAAVVGDAAFESGAALVSSAARQGIAALADVLRAHPDHRVYIQGHTDAVGAELPNQRLSELRAEAVRSLLVQEGVDADRLFAIGYGQARPVADNVTPQGRAQNRRVEIVIGERRTQAAR